MSVQFSRLFAVVTMSLVFTGCPGGGMPVPTMKSAELSLTGNLPVFGGVTIGATKSLTFTVTNIGTGDATLATIDSVGVGLSDPYALVGGTCRKDLVLHGGAGESCTITVRFTPTEQAHVGERLSINYFDVEQNAAGTAHMNLDGFGVLDCTAFPNSMCATDLPALSISDGAEFSFGSVALGDQREHTFTVSNTGRAAGALENISSAGLSLSAPFELVGGTCSSGQMLASLVGTCTLIVRYTPSALETSSASLSLNYSAMSGGILTTTRAMTGTGVLDCAAFPQPQCPVLAPALSLSDSPSYSFGLVALGVSAEHTFTVTNVGGSAGTLAAVTTSGLGLGSPFMLVGGSCATGTTLAAASGTCTLTIRFTPTVQTATSASLDLQYMGGATGTLDATRVISGQGVLDCANHPQPQCAPANLVGVYTRQNDNQRTSQNLNETILTPSNVNSTGFGKLFSVSVDGQIYAQPLLVPGLSMPGVGVRNVVFVATQHDSVYAFDADRVGAPLWHVSFINPSAGITTVPSSDVGSSDITPEIGITSTPVIDPNSNTIYVVAKTKENGTYIHRLHALDLLTGNERSGSPVDINATYSGTGSGSDATGQIPFNHLRQLQRPALTLSRGVVYMAFGSHGDNPPYHGWVLGYNATTLAQAAVFNTTPNGAAASIWINGSGLSVDTAGSLYFETGNGTFDADTGGSSFGDSFVKLSLGSGLARATGFSSVDFFTPFNEAILDSADLDLGSGGTLVVPDQAGAAHPRLLIGSGKTGVIYVLDRDSLGGFRVNLNSQIVQELDGAVAGVYSTPAYWQGQIYYHATDDVLKVFRFNSGLLSTAPVARGRATYGFPGATPSISANGATNAIVWDLDNHSFSTLGPAVLHAYDASNVAVELYNSAMAVGGRDTCGAAVKFTSPTVANGKVYVGGAGTLTVYGLLNL